MSTNTTSTENGTAQTRWLGPIPESNRYGDPTGAQIVECADCGVEVLR